MAGAALERYRRHRSSFLRRNRWVAATVGLGVIAAGMGIIAGATHATQAAQEPPPNTAPVQKGKLAAVVSVDGTLTYRARSDGSPYSVINQAQGRYTSLPEQGQNVDCGDVLYRVDNKPVLLLCGAVPAYRDVHYGHVGPDVAQLNQNLHSLGYDTKAGVDISPVDNTFSWMTDRALKALQRDRGASVTGELTLDDAVFLPQSVRIGKVTGATGGSGQSDAQVLLGGPAQPGTQVLLATSDTMEVQVDLDASQQGQVKPADPAQITLPGYTSVAGKVVRLGTVASVAQATGQSASAGAATLPAYISLDDPAAARGLDKAPVQVQITTDGVENALSVPVTALLGKSGGGFAVEVVRSDGRRDLVPVKLGLFDTAGGRVQVEGGLAEGDQVVVPSP